jgi:hypothetical protein
MKKVRNPINASRQRSGLERPTEDPGAREGLAPAPNEGEMTSPSEPSVFNSEDETVSVHERERDEWISKRAYSLWEQAGRPEGRHVEHWEQAVIDFKEKGNVDGEDAPDGVGAPGSSGTSRAT